MNKGIFTGNIGKDAVVRETNGRKAIGFNLAVNKKYKTSDGVEVESTLWVGCTIWRDKTQNTEQAKYLKAGTKLLVEGEISVEVYQNKENKWVPQLNLRVTNFEFLSAKKEETQPAAATKEPAMAAAAGGNGSMDEADNDLPF